jgi:hypothetical protein
VQIAKLAKWAAARDRKEARFQARLAAARVAREAASAKPDVLIECECKSPFVFTGRDQAFFALKGYAPPKFCPSCRNAKKARSASGGGGGGGGGGGFDDYSVLLEQFALDAGEGLYGANPYDD